MNLIGEYTVEYNIYTMFDVYNVQIVNHNLITTNGFDFFLKKWYTEKEKYPVVLGYYYQNKFYEDYDTDGTYYDDMSVDGKYSKTTTYIDKNTYKQYKWDGENFIGFNEKLERICIGICDYSDVNPIEPSETDEDLYSPTNKIKEYYVEEFKQGTTSLALQYSLRPTDLNGTTEIGVKTNHGRLVSHDIHPPYNLPSETDITLHYVFKLK